MTNNYFRIRGSTRARECFPFDDGSLDDTQRAWELASAAVRGNAEAVVVWRRPHNAGPWVLCEVVGELPAKKNGALGPMVLRLAGLAGEDDVGPPAFDD